MGGWHPGTPNRNAAPQRGRQGVLIRGEGDDSGLGVSGSQRATASHPRFRGFPISPQFATVCSPDRRASPAGCPQRTTASHFTTVIIFRSPIQGM